MKNAEVDTNIVDAWKMGYTGKGVVIGIVDDGVEGTHEDIAPNYNAALSRKFLGGKIYENQGPVNQKDNHGTAVAGVAAARGGNGIGGTGAAPYAAIAGLRLLDGSETDEDSFNAYMWKSGVDFTVDEIKKSVTFKAVAAPEIQIMNHSYGQKTPFVKEENYLFQALHETASNGVVHVFSAGNDRGTSNEDTNKTSINSYRDVINVAALGSDGKFSNYSSYGASVFVTAPSNRTDYYDSMVVPTGFGILTTDRTGKDLGYNAYSANNRCGDNWADCGDVFESFPDYNYTSKFGGTSSSAPLVSGIMALGREANPDLDARMAKHIIVKTSDIIDPYDNSSTGKWLKNGAGKWFNPNYGFGNINAGKFVDMAQKVAYVTEQTSYSTGTQNVSEGIKSAVSGGTSRAFSLTTAELADALRQPLEGVEVLLNFTHTKRGNLSASMTSPSGMQSKLFNSTAHLAADKQDIVSVTNFEWTFLSNAFWGESGLGTWTITMVDQINNNAGTWNSYNVTLLMGDIVLTGDLPDTQDKDIKARSLTLANSNKTYTIPSGLKFQARDNVNVEEGSLVVNGDITEDASGFGVAVNIGGGVVSGTGSIAASRGFINSGGTIKPGNSIGTLTITGDYNQGHQGKLLIEIASTASNDLLAINGAADLSGILETSWSGGYIPAVKTKFGTILTASSGVTGQFSSLLTNITPTVLFKPKYDIPNQIYLMVERDYTNPHLIPYLNANQRAIASMLNSVGNSATGDLDTVLTALDALPAYGQTAYALDQLAPKGTEAQSGMGINGVSFQTGNLSERLSDLRQGIRGISLNGLYFKNGNGKPVMLASINPDLTGMLPTGVNERWGFFVKGNASYGNQKDRPDSTGYDFTNTGITIGSDYRFTKSLIAGLMFGLNTSRANVDNAGSKVKMDGYTLGTYGTYYNKNIYIDGSVSYGFANYDNTRRIVFPGLDRTATSSPDGSQFTAYTGAGYDIRKNNWIITPNVSLQYINLNTDSYTESGAGALSLDVDKQNTESLQGNIGTRLSYAWQTNKAVIMPNIRASYGYEFLRDSQNITSRLTQGSSPFSIQTVSPDRSFLSLGTGITAFTVRDMSVYINYDVQIGENKYLAHNVNAGLRVGF
jgi:outer membrane autotransporter protein